MHHSATVVHGFEPIMEDARQCIDRSLGRQRRWRPQRPRPASSAGGLEALHDARIERFHSVVDARDERLAQTVAFGVHRRQGRQPRICESQPASAILGATIVVMIASRTLTAAVHQEEDWYVAQCLEVDVASQGETVEEALANLQEAVALYLDEIDDPDRHITRTPLVTSFQVPGAA